MKKSPARISPAGQTPTISLDTAIEDTGLSSPTKTYCQKRGVRFTGEIYRLPFDRLGSARRELERYLNGLNLPALVRGLTPDWRPSYVDDQAVRHCWDQPVGRLLLSSPEQPYEKDEYGYQPGDVGRWIRLNRRGHFFVGQALGSVQHSMWYLKDLQSVLRRRRWPLHAAMVVLDWTAPDEVPDDWQRYLAKVGLPERYQPKPGWLPLRPTPEEQAQYGNLKFLLGSVDELELSVRSDNALRALEITTVWGLVQRRPEELLEWRNFGPKSLKEIENSLAGYQLWLGMTESDLVKYVNAILLVRRVP